METITPFVRAILEGRPAIAWFSGWPPRNLTKKQKTFGEEYSEIMLKYLTGVNLMTQGNPPTVNPASGQIVTDVARKNYNPISEKQKNYCNEIKDMFNLVQNRLTEIEEDLGSDRLMALAKTEAEAASMWAVKSVTRPIPAEMEAQRQQDLNETQEDPPEAA